MFAIDRLSIERFRGLKDLTLDQLGRLNLLVGPNNSGKTSVIEAISIFCRPLDIRAWLEAAWRREILAASEPFFLYIEWAFPHWRSTDGPFVEGKVGISGTGNFPARELRATYKPTSRIPSKPAQTSGDPNGAGNPGYEQSGAQIVFEVTAEGPKGTATQFFHPYDLWEGEPLFVSDPPLALPVRTVTPVSHRAEIIPHELTQATLTGHKEQIVDLLRTIDSKILDVLILSPSGKIPATYVDYVSSGLLPLSALGDGVRRAFLIAMLLN
jgi:AAA ATPase domain